MPLSQESAALRKCIQDLELSFKRNLDQISMFLYQNEILSKRDYNEVRNTTTMLTPEDKAHMILEKLTDAVELDKDIYHTLVEYLRSEPVAYKVPLKRLEAAFPALNPNNQEEDDKGYSDLSEEPEEIAAAIATLSTRDAKKKYKIKLAKIPACKQGHLDDEIESDEHIYQIADHMTGWDAKPHLLKLNERDVSDIQDENRGKPKQQRSAAVLQWKNRVDYPTYRSLLCICVQGEWMHGANEIVNILKKV